MSDPVDEIRRMFEKPGVFEVAEKFAALLGTEVEKIETPKYETAKEVYEHVKETGTALLYSPKTGEWIDFYMVGKWVLVFDKKSNWREKSFYYELRGYDEKDLEKRIGYALPLYGFKIHFK